MVRAQLMLQPVISSVEELCAVINGDITRISKADYNMAKEIIERNRLRMLVSLKEELYRKKDLKSKEQLYKMICDEGDLKRFGVKTDGVTSGPSVIEIRSADPKILDKVSKL